MTRLRSDALCKDVRPKDVSASGTWQVHSTVRTGTGRPYSKFDPITITWRNLTDGTTHPTTGKACDQASTPLYLAHSDALKLLGRL